MELKKIHKQLDKIIDNVRFSDRLVLAMGSANNIEYLQNYLKCCRLEIQAVLDNDPQLEGSFVSGCRVYQPENILSKFNDKALIIIYSPRYWNQMKIQLENMGYKENKHFFIIKDFRKKRSFLNSFISQMVQVQKGFKVYKNLLQKYGNDTHIFICRGATGDAYINGLFLPEYVKKKEIRKYVLAGDAKGLAKIAPLFDICDIAPLSFDEAEQVQKLYMLSIVSNITDLFMWQHTLYFNRSRIRMTEKFNFMDTYQYFTYNNLVSKDKWKLPEFKRLDEELEKRLIDQGMMKGRTVIIAPYAYSVKNLPVWFWDKVTEILINKGYEVFANINSETEVCPFKNMKSIFFTFSESVTILQYAGCFLGLRSGFCDIISSAECKKIILYPCKPQKVDYSVHRSDLEFSGLEIMGLTEGDVYEIASPLIKDITNKTGIPYSVSELSDMYNDLINKIVENIVIN